MSNRSGARVRALGLLWLVVLGGCATVPQETTPALDARWATHRAAVTALESFALNGRVALQRGSEGGGVKLRWEQRGADTELRIMAPLAQGSYRLRGDPQRVVLSAPDGREYRARSFEALMQVHLGWSFPVDGARYWIRGIPDPQLPIERLDLDAEGRLRDLAQAGWRISVLDYAPAAGTALPQRLFLNTADLKIKIAIDAWQVPAP